MDPISMSNHLKKIRNSKTETLLDSRSFHRNHDVFEIKQAKITYIDHEKNSKEIINPCSPTYTILHDNFSINNEKRVSNTSARSNDIFKINEISTFLVNRSTPKHLKYFRIIA